MKDDAEVAGLGFGKVCVAMLVTSTDESSLETRSVCVDEFPVSDTFARFASTALSTWTVSQLSSALSVCD